MLVVYLARTLGKWIHSGQVGLFLTLGQTLLLRIAVTSPKYVDEDVIEDFLQWDRKIFAFLSVLFYAVINEERTF